MNIDPVFNAGAIGRPRVDRDSIDAGASPAGSKFGAALAAAIDDVSGAIDRADMLAGNVAGGHGSVADASIARAKADVMLEVVAVAASRITAALSALLQTQV